MADYPNGCAEQTISTAWASLLLQRYAAAVPQIGEKLQQQTHRNLEEAYENLLADQLPNGGFAYWSRDRYADLALTAYAIQFLTEARQFITIDDAVLTKAVAYLAQQQQPNSQSTAGLWIRVDRDHTRHPEDSRGNAMLTASVAAMIAGAPNSEPLLEKAVAALQPFIEEYDEPYTLASYTLASVALKDTTRSEPAIKRLRAMALSQDGGAYWSLETNTPFFGWGTAGRVETTAQVLHAFLAAGVQPQDDLVARGLLFLDHKQDRYSLWYSTQATARVLDVLAEISLRSPSVSSESSPGNLNVQVDSQPVIAVPLPAAVQDAGPIFVPLGAALTAGGHRVTLVLPGNSQSATAQLVSGLYRPWSAISPTSAVVNNEQIRMTVGFGTTRPSPGQEVEVTAHLERIGYQGYGMMIGEIGLPPGADVDRASLESAVGASDYQLNHYEVLPDKVLIYVWPRAGGLTMHFHFTFRYAIDALTAPSSVYDYYNPDARFDLKPARFKTR